MEETYEELNIEWIGICQMMQLLNVQRIATYKRWKAKAEADGADFSEGFPLQIDWQPSFFLDLDGKNITVIPLDDMEH
jgi:hypothetical protein